MKRMFYWTVLTVFMFCFGNVNAQESKYKLKLKGAAARAYVREHGYPVRHRVSDGKSGSSARKTTYQTRSAKLQKPHAGRSTVKSGKTAHRTSVYKGKSNKYYGGYGRRSAAYYTGYRQETKWDKVKVKSKKDKLVYKFKKDD